MLKSRRPAPEKINSSDIIRLLVMYKPAVQKIFHGQVLLSWDREKKEIQLEIPCTGNYYSKEALAHTNFHKRNLDELIPAVVLMKTVDDWMDLLTMQEAEALFLRFVDVDHKGLHQLKLMSYKEIGKKMGLDKKTVWEHVQRALAKIQKLAFPHEI